MSRCQDEATAAVGSYDTRKQQQASGVSEGAAPSKSVQVGWLYNPPQFVCVKGGVV